MALLSAAACQTASSEVKVQSPRVSQAPGSPAAPGESRGHEPSARAMRAFDDAVRAFQDQTRSGKPDYAELERKFKEVVALDDGFAEAYDDLGVIYERWHKPDQAEQAYRTALAKKPTLRQAAENLAVMQENAGKQEQALALYQDLARKYPQDGGSRARLASLYHQAGQDDEALKLAREALMRDPKNVTAYKVMMRVYLARKNLSLAQLVALRAIKLDASDPELYHTVGLILLEQGDELGALEQFQKAVKERDEFLPARLKIAEIAAKHRDWATAARQYERIAQLQPHNAAAHLDLGIAYKGLGQVDKAFREYEEAKKLDANDAEVYYALGVVFEKNKQLPDKALESYKAFLAKSGTVAGDHPVFQNIKNCEQLIALQQQAKEQEEEAKRQAELQKKQQELEAKNKAVADKAKPSPGAPAPTPAPNGAGAAPTGPGKPEGKPASAAPPATPREAKPASGQPAASQGEPAGDEPPDAP